MSPTLTITFVVKGFCAKGVGDSWYVAVLPSPVNSFWVTSLNDWLALSYTHILITASIAGAVLNLIATLFGTAKELSVSKTW